MISFFDVRVWDCRKIKHEIVYKLLIINILYYYYTHYYLSNYLFKLKSIINNSIWLYYPLLRNNQRLFRNKAPLFENNPALLKNTRPLPEKKSAFAWKSE